MVNLHGLRVDVRFQRIERVGEWGQGERAARRLGLGLDRIRAEPRGDCGDTQCAGLES
jgi:hypothetical protein